MYFFSGIRRTRKGDEDAESTPDHGLLVGASRRDLGLTMHHRYIVTSSRLHSFPCMSGTEGGGEGGTCIFVRGGESRQNGLMYAVSTEVVSAYLCCPAA